jgi:hypothetical protein
MQRPIQTDRLALRSRSGNATFRGLLCKLQPGRLGSIHELPFCALARLRSPDENEQAEQIGHHHEGEEAEQADEHALLKAEGHWETTFLRANAALVGSAGEIRTAPFGISLCRFYRFGLGPA